MKLFLIHCGFYDTEICEGVFEMHTNFFIIAESAEDARKKAKEKPVFQAKRMHVDGILQIEYVDGYRVAINEDLTLNGGSKIETYQFRDLAPKKPI